MTPIVNDVEDRRRPEAKPKGLLGTASKSWRLAVADDGPATQKVRAKTKETSSSLRLIIGW